jgi:2-dehydro-3-deoxygluconokinase
VSQPVPFAAVRNAAGAGDAFAGAYLSSRLAGRAPAVALAWGVAAASLSVGEDGCARSYPAHDQVARLAAALPTQATRERSAPERGATNEEWSRLAKRDPVA